MTKSNATKIELELLCDTETFVSSECDASPMEHMEQDKANSPEGRAHTPDLGLIVAG